MLLVGRQEGRPAYKKLEWWGVGVVICLQRGAHLHMAQLMPLPLTVSCFSKIQIGFTFLVPAHPGSPGQRAVKRGCGVCVDGCRCRIVSTWLKSRGWRESRWTRRRCWNARPRRRRRPTTGWRSCCRNRRLWVIARRGDRNRRKRPTSELASGFVA